MKAVPGRIGLLIGLGSKESGEESSDPSREARMAAARAIGAAIESKDWAKLSDALLEHQRCCEGEPEGEAEDPNEGDMASHGASAR